MSRFFTALLLLLPLIATAQFASPLTFSVSSTHLAGDEFELTVKASAEAGWAIYSVYTPDDGPVPTSFAWVEGDHYELVGEVREVGHLKEGFDELFGTDVKKFLSDEPVSFVQTVRVKAYGTPISVMMEYMCCNDEQCLPPTEEEFSWTPPPPSPDRGSTPPPTPAPDAPASTNDTEVTDNSAPSPPSLAPAAAPTAPREILATYRAAGPQATENDPISWAFEADDYGDGEYVLRMTGELEAGWTTYGKDADPDIGPVPNEFYVATGGGVVPLGEVTETSATLKAKFDNTWDAVVPKIDGGTVTYEQRVRATGASAIEGYVYYQTCDDEICFPPKEIPFKLALSGATPLATVDGLAGSAGVELGGTDAGASTVGKEQAVIATEFNTEPLGSCSVGVAETKNLGLPSVFGLGFLGGLFALIMPCIFPMIPLTVSFFTKSSGTRAQGVRRATLYGFFIFLIYVLLSAPFHLIQGLDPGLLNNIASSVPLNVAFFAVFIFFAGSFFGFYEIALPESWSNRASQAEGTGGVAGIFFMALTLALVSFSCTGPILGSLLVESVSGGAWPLTAGMAGFGVALGLPFALFAAFPGFLNSMPKSGGWLNSVKVVLGFAEVALAFKFLSNADLVGEWAFLRIEPFLVIWILCALGIAAYLFKLISFPLDSKRRNIGATGGVVGGLSLAFALYLGLGLTTSDDTGTYRVRNVLSGIAPPVCYNFFEPCAETTFKSLEDGLAHARKVGKPVMLDFTGYTCVNCRKMEENVWTDDRIDKFLRDEYVIISLYVDDRSELPEAEHLTVDRMDGTGRTRVIDQVGEKWHYLQQSVFERSSQPYYVLVSPDGRTLNEPVAYTPDVDTYENFLACGLSTFRELSK